MYPVLRDRNSDDLGSFFSKHWLSVSLFLLHRVKVRYFLTLDREFNEWSIIP
jgi:hypothetical protein